MQIPQIPSFDIVIDYKKNPPCFLSEITCRLVIGNNG